MNIAHLRRSFIDNGIAADEFERLHDLAEALPKSYMAAEMRGLDESEAATLVSRLLQELAPTIGVAFDHPDVLDQLGFPVHEPALDSHAAESDAAAEQANRYASRSAG